ncbi:MAG TPA: hypothetical protein VMG60_21265 [Burkholderiaceae bacterium]|nr:hypothetical protein [Burkholderiaceae bacterium]
MVPYILWVETKKKFFRSPSCRHDAAALRAPAAAIARSIEKCGRLRRVRALAGCVAPSPPKVELAQETPLQLADGPGKDKFGQCAACHSLDYIEMNSRFLDKAGWTGTDNRMINAFAAPIPKEDVEPIAAYLAQHYGKEPLPR